MTGEDWILLFGTLTIISGVLVAMGLLAYGIENALKDWRSATRCEWSPRVSIDGIEVRACPFQQRTILTFVGEQKPIRLCTRHVRVLVPELVPLRWTGAYYAGPRTFAGAYRRLGRALRIAWGTAARDIVNGIGQ